MLSLSLPDGSQGNMAFACTALRQAQGDCLPATSNCSTTEIPVFLPRFPSFRARKEFRKRGLEKLQEGLEKENAGFPILQARVEKMKMLLERVNACILFLQAC